MPAAACSSKLIIAMSANVLSMVSRCSPALIVLVGCSRAPTPPPKPLTAAAPPRALGSFSFATPSLKAIATRFDAAATGICDPNWSTRPLAECFWTPTRYAANWELLDTDNVEHKIELALTSSPLLPNEIRAVSISGQYNPSSGWGALVSYSVMRDDSQSLGAFGMAFTDVSQPGRAAPPRFTLRLPGRSCDVEIRDGQNSLIFRVEAAGDGYEKVTSVNEQVGAYLASPESLRRSALNELATLESKARQDVETGAAWGGVIDRVNVRSDDPPRARPPRGSLAPELKAEALEALLAEIERRRQLVRVHYQAMHASAQRAFPLYGCICTDATEKGDLSGFQDGETPNQSLDRSGRSSGNQVER